MTDLRVIMADGSQSANMAETYADLPLLFETDEYGEPKTLVNADAWRVLTAKILKTDLSMFDRMFTAEALHQMYLQEPLLLSKFQGVVLPLNQTLKQEVQLPSPFGEGTIEAETTTTMTAIDRQKGIATANSVLRFKPEAATQAAKTFIGKVLKNKGKSDAEIETELAKVAFEVFREDTTETVIDLATGWPIETNARREVRTGERDQPSGKLEVWKIKVERTQP